MGLKEGGGRHFQSILERGAKFFNQVIPEILQVKLSWRGKIYLNKFESLCRMDNNIRRQDDLETAHLSVAHKIFE